MEKRQYGNTDLQVSVLGHGGGELGGLGAAELHPKKLEVSEAVRVLSTALDTGVNVIDTAECYNDSEELIGQAISHRRKEFYLFTKCGHSQGFELPHWHKDMLEASIDRSLRRLRTDYLDVVHLHTCSEAILRQGDAIDVLLRAKEKGKIRYIGYSGDHKEALYAVRCGAFDSLMTSVNIADQEAIELTIPEAARAGLGITAKRPVANVVWRYEALPQNPYHHDYWHRLKQLNYDALQRSFREGFAMALRFTLSVPGIHTAIIGTTNPARWGVNAEVARQGPLSEADYASIRAEWKIRAGADWIGLE